MQDSVGGLIISDEVIASIAVNAAKDVEGVAGFSVNPMDFKGILKKKVSDKGVKVAVTDNDIVIDVFIDIESGRKIPIVAESIQLKVKEAVQTMTNRVVSKVNVTIAGIKFDETFDEDIKPALN